MKPLLPSALLGLGLLTSASLASADTCKWADGPDKAAPANDPGRGVADWSAHANHVHSGTGLQDAHDLVAARMATLKACGAKDAYARVYADVSVLIGHYGRSQAAWKDGSDPAAPKDDPGRGVASWSAHRDHVLKGAGMDNAHKLVGVRLKTLSTVLPKPMYARLYADVSILLANLARSY
jgi:hypothetical protein